MHCCDVICGKVAVLTKPIFPQKLNVLLWLRRRSLHGVISHTNAKQHSKRMPIPEQYETTCIAVLYTETKLITARFRWKTPFGKITLSNPLYLRPYNGCTSCFITTISNPEMFMFAIRVGFIIMSRATQ